MDNQGFNPRTRVGCDRSNLSTPDTPMLFQSTHPRGVRRDRAAACGKLDCFNPRTRVGCDYWGCPSSRSVSLFQSTHPRGVRHGFHILRTHGNHVSIHAPAWGATKSPVPLTDLQ